MEYIYILTCQDEQGAPEIYSFFDNYQSSLITYYEYNESNGYYQKKDDDTYWHYELYKFPINTFFTEIGVSSKIKISKSSKYRIKHKNWGEIRKEYISLKRDEKIENILNGTKD